MQNHTPNSMKKFLFFLLVITFSSCLLPESFTFNDYSALMAFKSHLILKKDDLLFTNWTSNTHYCNWYGVSCLNNRVVSLYLRGMDLLGTISSDIGNLTELVELDLSNNEFRGFLPNELGLLRRLRLFNASENSIHGIIPGNLSRCQKLEELDISENFITGGIPLELGEIGELKVLLLSHNNLTGKIPVSLGNLSNLYFMFLHVNQLFDEMPESLGGLVSLKVVSFRGNSFIGSIPSSIFNISSLEIVDFSMNAFSGTLPVDMGMKLPNLEKLFLISNSFTGSIPSSIFNISSLEVVAFSKNAFSGTLPVDLGMKLPNLERLFLDSNRITGNIPVSLVNSSKLSYLYLTENDLTGQIPSEFSKLKNMQWFEFESNRISGNIPEGFFNLFSLQVLKAQQNYLKGQVPSDLGRWLPNLLNLLLSDNQFYGSIPSTICNATKLTFLEVANNSFTGQVPRMLGNLIDLQHLNLQNNLFVNEPHEKYLGFLDSLVNCRSLEYLILESNPLNGVLPESVGNLSVSLKVFAAASCLISGTIPNGIGNLSSLSYLGLNLNNLEGNIPSSFSGLKNLERIYLTNNMLTGTVPNVLGTLKHLGILHLGENKFTGVIPSFIGNLTNMVELSLAYNGLHSEVPLSLWALVKLEGLNLSMNQLEGTLSPEVGNLKAMTIMDVSSNNFSGEIPDSIGYLQNLIAFYLSHNSFDGPIPNVFSKLISLNYLDLSSNSLNGSIPTSLELLEDLSYLNVSFNKLQGPLPDKGVFSNITYQSIMGNTELCGSPDLNLLPCKFQKSHQTRKSLVLKIVLPVCFLFIVIVVAVVTRLIIKKHGSRNDAEDSSLPIRHRSVTYHELVTATNHFSELNLLGKGSTGMVYKGTLNDDTIVAIKVFNMLREDTIKNFDVECEVLRNVRHRNLVKIISVCSNMEFKAMVLEFMPNGSLDEWLHSPIKFLTLRQRVNILVDTAQAIAYLHHGYTTTIVHCDLKPSNVLLDDDMTAHVADFGIAKIFAQDQHVAQTSTLGTIGYIAPEYGVDGKISTKNDVYSYGILLLETLTGKRPTDPLFVVGVEDLNLQKWVTRSFPDALMDVLDTRLRSEVYRSNADSENPGGEKFLNSIMNVGLMCLKESPEERVSMREVVLQLKKIQIEKIGSDEK